MSVFFCAGCKGSLLVYGRNGRLKVRLFRERMLLVFCWGASEMICQVPDLHPASSMRLSASISTLPRILSYILEHRDRCNVSGLHLLASRMCSISYAVFRVAIAARERYSKRKAHVLSFPNSALFYCWEEWLRRVLIVTQAHGRDHGSRHGKSQGR